jgi:isopentenyl diphosphate isomerase/L-lactate dehydrogenase-like FMN-dependent dehydrogenase
LGVLTRGSNGLRGETREGGLFAPFGVPDQLEHITVHGRLDPVLFRQFDDFPLAIVDFSRPSGLKVLPHGGAGILIDLATVSLWAENRFKGAVTASDLEWLRKIWPRKLVVKGVLDPDDAKLAVKIGVNAIVISNHGGRQLDGAASTIEMLPSIREAVGDDLQRILDSGVRSGYDVLKAMARGANGCLLDRAYVYGLAAHGQAGVTAALDLMAQELDEAMILTGAADVNALPEGLALSR